MVLFRFLNQQTRIRKAIFAMGRAKTRPDLMAGADFTPPYAVW
jgi:hypothetical protein